MKKDKGEFTLEEGTPISNWLECEYCGNSSDMHCICEGKYDTSTHKFEATFWEISYYKILLCLNCNEVTVIRYVTHDNDACLEHKRDGLRYLDYITEILYPAKKSYESIPDEIENVVNEAEKIVALSPRAAFILCRAALEEICRQYNIPDKKKTSKDKDIFIGLEEKLEMLCDKENLSEDLKNIMNGIRLLGNEGTHGSHNIITSKISSTEVKILLDLLDYVLNRLYIDKDRAIDAARKLEILRDKVLNSKGGSS